jgi:hypothetical protein
MNLPVALPRIVGATRFLHSRVPLAIEKRET